MLSRRNHVVAVVLWLTTIARGGWASDDEANVDQAISKTASYKFGESRENLSAVEALVNCAGQQPGGADRLAAKLHPLLAKGATLDCKQFVCRQLAVLGSKDSVAPLTSLLADEQLSDMARYALESIPDSVAGQALLAALGGQPSKKSTIGIINSLGNRHEIAAITALIERCQTGDAEIRAAAIHALGQIGGEQSARALLRLQETAGSDLRESVLQASLACADQFASLRQTAAAKALYQSAFLESRPVMIRVAAFKGLVAVDNEQALSLILKHLGDQESALQDAALSLVRKFPGDAATQKFALQVMKLSPPRQALLVRALADRGDRSVMPVVMSALDSTDEAVRTAALYALGRVGNAEAVERLAQAASLAPGPEQAAARESLVVLRGEGVDGTILALLEKPTVKTRAQLVAALGPRNSSGAVKTLLQTAKDPDSAVRLASVTALGDLASERELPALVEMVQQAESGDELEAAENSVVATARRIAESDRRLTVVLSTLTESKDAGVRVRLLPVVGRIGGDRALVAVDSAIHENKDAQVREVAVRTLAAWSDPEALPKLLTIAKSSDLPAHRLLALQGYIRLLAVPSAQPPQEKLAAYREAFGLATRANEKAQILSGLPRVRISETLAFVLPLLNDPELSEDAARAAVLLSTVGRRSTIPRDEARAAMRQVMAATKNSTIRDAAKSILESPEQR